MTPGERKRVNQVTGPDGVVLTRETMPEPGRRWTPLRKAQVIYATRNGLMTIAEVCEKYTLTDEEFMGWCSLFDRHGIDGLRSNSLKLYRPTAG